VVPLGDLAAYVEFSRTLDLQVNELAQRLAAAIEQRRVPWIHDVVPALGGVALHFDPSFDGNPLEAAALLVDECLRKGLPRARDIGRDLEVPVCYDEEFAPDLEEVAQKTRLSRDEVVRRHAASAFRVLMIGFAPGHPYIGGLDPKLAVPRRATPRAVVPAGSIAIANVQTVVYPYAISGGWSVIGRTPLTIFDAGRAEPSLFAAGDRVKFFPIPREEFEKLSKNP
jgi:KipI family sensor histidine kinase inhibitor